MLFHDDAFVGVSDLGRLGRVGRRPIFLEI